MAGVTRPQKTKRLRSTKFTWDTNGDTDIYATFSEGLKKSKSSDIVRTSSSNPRLSHKHTSGASEGSAITPPISTSPVAISGEEEFQDRYNKRRARQTPFMCPVKVHHLQALKGCEEQHYRSHNQRLTVGEANGTVNH